MFFTSPGKTVVPCECSRVSSRGGADGGRGEEKCIFRISTTKSRTLNYRTKQSLIKNHQEKDHERTKNTTMGSETIAYSYY